MMLRWVEAPRPTGQMWTARLGHIAQLRVVTSGHGEWMAGVTFAGALEPYHVDGVSGVTFATRDLAVERLCAALMDELTAGIQSLYGELSVVMEAGHDE